MMDGDEDLARMLQEQELLSLEGDEDARVAALYQIQGGDQTDQAIANTMQKGFSHRQIHTDHMLAARMIHDHQNQHRGGQTDQAIAQMLHEQLSEDQVDSDHMIAATATTNQECGSRAQNNNQQGARPRQDSATARDEEFAREVASKQEVYQLQLDEDEQLARTLAEQDRHANKRPMRNTPGNLPFGVSYTGMPQLGFQGEAFVDLHATGNQHHMHHPGSNIQDALDSGNIPDSYEDLLDLEEQIGDAKSEGLETNEINSLPTLTYKSAQMSQGGASAQEDADDKLCKICREDFNDGENIKALPCLHKYHADCIDPWIMRKGNCPTCKLDLKEEIHKQASQS